MGIATQQLVPPVAPSILDKDTSNSTSMSQEFHHPHHHHSHHHHHQGSLFTFSNGFERSVATAAGLTDQAPHPHHPHITHQIRRDKLRTQGFDPPPPPPLVGIEDEPSGLPVYETAGMLSEMFDFAPGGTTPGEFIQQATPTPDRTATGLGGELWYGGNRQLGIVPNLGPLGDNNSKNSQSGGGGSGGVNSSNHHGHPHHHHISNMNASDPTSAMQLFLMNPQPRSPSPPTPHPHHHHHQQQHDHTPPSSTLHMLLPTPSNNTTSLQAFSNNLNPSSVSPSNFPPHHQFSWASSDHNHSTSVEGGQGLSLSLSSSLQHLEAAKAEELRLNAGDHGDGIGSSVLFYGGHGIQQYPYKNSTTLCGINVSNPFGYIGPSSSSSTPSPLGVNILRNSKYLKPAQELLEEFCSVGRGQFKKNKFGRQLSSSSNPSGGGGGSGSGVSSSSKDLPPLSAADRMDHQRRKVKLLAMLDEVDRRYNHYCEQMQMVVNSFDIVMGLGAAVPYTALAQKAMSRHFRCLKDAISAQLKHSCELLGEKDGAGSSGITKGETPRLKLLDQSLRQQRAFHQMGMMEQEAWRPQRGLPERSVNTLRAWLFEHFLHPYPSDADKHLLARQTGLSRNQVSNWFINARVRLWKPMVEEMYQQEAKEDEEEEEYNEGGRERDSNNTTNNSSSSNIIINNTTNHVAQTPTPTTTTEIAAVSITAAPAGIRSEINATENDPSLNAINRPPFSENQARQQQPPPPLATPTTASDDTCRGSIASQEFGTAPDNVGPTLIRFGATAGDVSLTLGLRHAGNMPDKSSNFSITDFGSC